MSSNNYLSLQANIICLLLALVGATAIIRHPDWFGRVPSASQSEMLTPDWPYSDRLAR
jgi:multisubunit Na+/H+ antiporter MnhG subunit